MKKCLPTLLYATEVCPLNISDVAGLYSALRKVFVTNSKEITLECILMFDLNSIGAILLKNQRNFLLACRGLDKILINHSIAPLSANCMISGQQNIAVLTSLLS